MEYIDVHAHLHDKAFDADREQIILEMQSLGIGAITVGTDYKESKKAVELAQVHDNIWATVGFHPVDNKEEVFEVENYEELAHHSKVVAIGECGLDYHHPTEDGYMDDDEKERQVSLFRRQIELAIRVRKPLMLHGRPSKGSMDAYEDMLSVLGDYKERVKGNVHFFVGEIYIAEQFVELGFTMSFPGVITFAKELEKTVAHVPIEHIHAETDSPYATPAPYRGKRNSPLYLPLIAITLADIKKMDLEDMKERLLENARNIFQLTIEG